MALSLEEKMELQVAIMQDLEQLDKIDDIAERFAVQLRIKENLDKLKEDSPTIPQEETTPLPEEPTPPAPTGITEEYRKLLAGEYNGLKPNSFKKKVKSICVDEAATCFAVKKESPTYGDLNSKAADLMEEPIRRYLDAHYNAEKDVFEYKAA